mmetsp:Transcript_12514/g.22689  ORF Transcript_12514/g.22689 Transcript_12514/m.22689 type:complete len:105 (+) Transcript_12514:495-809(+)
MFCMSIGSLSSRSHHDGTCVTVLSVGRILGAPIGISKPPSFPQTTTTTTRLDHASHEPTICICYMATHISRSKNLFYLHIIHQHRVHTFALDANQPLVTLMPII